jgi:hypothetical protein
MNSRAIYLVSLQAGPHVDGQRAVRGLRMLLKRCWRDYGLRCLEIREAPEPDNPFRRAETAQSARRRFSAEHVKKGN